MAKYGEPPMNHGVQFPAGPGAGQPPASQVPCRCELVEVTVNVPAYVADHIRRHAAASSLSVDQLAAGALKQFGTAPTDPCIAIP